LTPEQKALALRAIAAGAPVPGWEPASVGSILTNSGLPYEVAWGEKASGRRGLVLLPVLSDFRWLGWVLEEVERRGWAYTLQMQGEPTPWREYRGAFRSTTALMAVLGDESEEFKSSWPDVCCVRHLDGEPFARVKGAMSETVAERAAADERLPDRMVEPGTYWVTLRHPTKRDVLAAHFEDRPSALVAMLEAAL